MISACSWELYFRWSAESRTHFTRGSMKQDVGSVIFNACYVIFREKREATLIARGDDGKLIAQQYSISCASIKSVHSCNRNARASYSLLSCDAIRFGRDFGRNFGRALDRFRVWERRYERHSCHLSFSRHEGPMNRRHGEVGVDSTSLFLSFSGILRSGWHEVKRANWARSLADIPLICACLC